MSQSNPIFNGGESPLAVNSGAEAASFQPASGAAQTDGGSAPKPPAAATSAPAAETEFDASGLAEGSGIMRP